jgi:hypothetical protein
LGVVGERIRFGGIEVQRGPCIVVLEEQSKRQHARHTDFGVRLSPELWPSPVIGQITGTAHCFATDRLNARTGAYFVLDRLNSNHDSTAGRQGVETPAVQHGDTGILRSIDLFGAEVDDHLQSLTTRFGLEQHLGHTHELVQ